MADNVIQAVTGKFVEYLVDALKKQLKYLFCYSCNVQTLADEVGKLNIRHESVQQDVVAARANLAVIRPEVEAWLRNVDELKRRSDEIRGVAEEIRRSSVCKWFPLLHYSLSRKALKAARDCVELRNTTFDRIFNPRIPAELPPVPTSYFDFESRKEIEDKIMYSLNDPNVYLIGIWGVGGVGKTKMVKKFEEKFKKTLFEHVVMVVVSQQPDLPKLQSQIAKELSLKLSEDSPAHRQKELHERLMAEKSILIILDDLWERLDLEELGIPSKHCKLILTSRDEYALTSTGVRNIFQLEILTEEESWRFFRDNAGINDNDDDDSRNELVEIARKVERECKGLPLALKIVASALKGKRIYSWKTALEELKKAAPEIISDVLKGVYQPLKYSFEMLENEGQKYLFLLCCLFPEDYSISIEELLRWGIGLRIFNGINSLTEYRNKVKSVLDILLRRSLLIMENKYRENFEVRMHDVIRDVGIWIATEEGMVVSNEETQQFMIKHGLNECPSMTKEHSPNINNCTFISLHFSHYSITFPKSIVYPKLELLRLDVVGSFFDLDAVRRSFFYGHLELPDNFFNGMGKLKVLEALGIGLLPPSIGELNRLHTLVLRNCNIFWTVSMLGKLINLEILNLDCCNFEMLPIEIGMLKNLKQLKILDVNRVGRIAVGVTSELTTFEGRIAVTRLEGRIAVGVISELTRLEELVILGFFDNWEAEDGIACLRELDSLKRLTTLKIEIKNPRVIPREKPQWVQNLESYSIAISLIRDDNDRGFKKSIMLGEEVVNPFGNWIYDMTRDAECLDLQGSNCMIVVKWLSQNSGNLSCLKKLNLAKFTNIRYLAEGRQKGAIFPRLEYLQISYSDSLQQIFDVSPPIGSFVELQDIFLNSLFELTCLWNVSVKEHLYLKNLQTIQIYSCKNLVYMFPLSVAQSLVQLSSLCVSFCETMKEIFKKDDGELVEKIELPKLMFLFFENLKNFCDFCNGIDGIELPKLINLTLYELPSIKQTKGDNNEVHQRDLIPQVAGMIFNFCGLTDLRLIEIGNFKYIFSPSVISGVPNLRILEVRNCSMLEEVIGKDDENVGDTILFPNLMEFYLSNLPNILTFCYKAIQLPSLEELTIHDCPKMLKFVEESNSTPFINKQVCCPKLRHLCLKKLNISAVFSLPTFTSLTNLGSLKVRKCEELEHIIIKEEEGETTYEEFTQKVPLRYLYLKKLSKLYRSIFEMKHPLEFPSLDKIEIEDCPMLEKFSLGSVHLPELEITPILEIHSEKNCFIISIKDISFSSDLPEDIKLRFLPIGSSQSFANVIFLSKRRKIVGKFKIEKIQTGTEYEIMLMIMWDEDRMWGEDESELIELVEIELKIPGESKLHQRTETLKNEAKRIWTEISIGKFIMREPQQINEELEFSLRNAADTHLWVKGVRIVEV